MSRNVPNPDCLQCATRLNSAFETLPESDLPILTNSKVCRLFKKGEHIYLAGDKAAGLYCLHSGKVKVYRAGSDGREQIVRLAKPGDPLGYRALLGNGLHSTNATALEDTHACFIARETFFSILSARPAFSMKLFDILSYDLEQVERKVVEMAQKPIKERLAEALLLLQHTYGFKEDQRTLDVKITRDDIAGIVGAATESVIRNLTELKEEGIVGLEGRSIQVLDSEALLHTANLEM